MGQLFSRRKAPPLPEVTQQDQAILQLKTQRDRIKQYIRRNEKLMEREKELARELIRTGRKDRALLMLRKKRYQESMIDRTLKQLNQIEQMVYNLEFTDIEKRVLDGLKSGNEALKQMNQMFSIEEIERIMDETREGAEYQEEISNLLRGKLSESELAECEEELNDIVAKQVDEVKFPEVPTDELEKEAAVREGERRVKHAKEREAVALEAS